MRPAGSICARTRYDDFAIPSIRGILTTFQTGSGDCNPLHWTTPSVDVRVDPPKDTVAVVVDVRGGQGAIRINNTQDNKHVDKVGPIKGAGNLVIVLWKSDWWYYAIGFVRVAHIGKKS